MAVRAIRGATQLDTDERDHLLSSVVELLTEIMQQNQLDLDQLISILFTATPDLRAEFPAVAARALGMGDVPLICAREMDVQGALPRVIRVMAYADMDCDRSAVKHVYLRGAVALRVDLAQ